MSVKVYDAPGLTAGITYDGVKTLTDNTATSLFEIALPAAGMTGGQLHYLVRCSDGTDHQTIAGDLSFSAVNKAGTITPTASTDTQAVSLSGASTNTTAVSVVAGASKITVKITSNTSLTATTFQCRWVLVYLGVNAVTKL